MEGEFLCFRVRKRRRKERAERDRDFKGREQIFTGSKTKKYIYSVVLGLEGVGLEQSLLVALFVILIYRDCGDRFLLGIPVGAQLWRAPGSGPGEGQEGPQSPGALPEYSDFCK